MNFYVQIHLQERVVFAGQVNADNVHSALLEVFKLKWLPWPTFAEMEQRGNPRMEISVRAT
jgi:hypothetical protein